jgi:opacity protein-like surface antigen
MRNSIILVLANLLIVTNIFAADYVKLYKFGFDPEKIEVKNDEKSAPFYLRASLGGIYGSPLTIVDNGSKERYQEAEYALDQYNNQAKSIPDRPAGFFVRVKNKADANKVEFNSVVLQPVVSLALGSRFLKNFSFELACDFSALLFDEEFKSSLLHIAPNLEDRNCGTYSKDLQIDQYNKYESTYNAKNRRDARVILDDGVHKYSGKYNFYHTCVELKLYADILKLNDMLRVYVGGGFGAVRIFHKIQGQHRASSECDEVVDSVHTTPYNQEESDQFNLSYAKINRAYSATVGLSLNLDYTSISIEYVWQDLGEFNHQYEIGKYSDDKAKPLFHRNYRDINRLHVRILFDL